jgi:esterase/lipase superfamily enzyme
MLRRHEKLPSPSIGRDVEMLIYGFFGPPMIVFPTAGGRFYDFENNGMIDAVAPWLDAGKVKLYCIDGIDRESWINGDLTPAERARRHNDYKDFVVNTLTPAIRSDCATPDAKIAVTGCSLGGFHAANCALQFPHIFNYALCLSGRYNIEAICGYSDALDVYFNNPVAYTYHLSGEALERVRRDAHLVLVCGQGAWEDVCLAEAHRLADILAAQGISHERDIWGHDVEHHWYWWRKQIALHFGKALGQP